MSAPLDASCVDLIGNPTPILEMAALREALGGGPRLLVKRDDTIPFGFGGNKVRKLQFEAKRAISAGADTLVTLGGLQSNHARVTAAVAAKLGLRCLLIVNGEPQERPTGNALLDRLLGAEVEYIPSRHERAESIERVLNRLRREGRRPFLIPLGASTSFGALGFVQAVREMVDQGVKPDVIIHAGSSGGTQAGLLAGVATYGLGTRVVAVSADDPAESIRNTVRSIVRGIEGLEAFNGDIEVDDTRVGAGYGAPTDASREAQQLAARREGFFVDHTYTAKALGALIAYVRDGRFAAGHTVLFWHTGGQVGLFA
ncbi:MAG TPA: D-cysteine desulfhydrase family protein [Gemmatimonadaceae bacterium]|jgi:1-aminocyclopropane-1-carboxylate deaminase/D-cysteine desulfhydrase-like pyridoxal-dependent ACC family enzyme|nr:D-cysteine desulfhydrase family protein [Gemmatimonadaceae bacterium]